LRRPVWRDCVRHQEVRANRHGFPAPIARVLSRRGYRRCFLDCSRDRFARQSQRSAAAVENGEEALCLPTSRPNQARAMACSASARSARRPAPDCHGAGDRRRRDANSCEGPMAGLVGNIALADVLPVRRSACAAKPCTRKRRRRPASGCCSAEVRSSNPLRSTTRSGQTDPISRAIKILAIPVG